MALSFLSVSGRPSAFLISCLVAPPAPPPPNPNPTALPSLTCALQCPHFQSCSGCTQEYNLHRPIILDEATDFFNKHGVSDFTFDTCRLWGWRCRAKLAVRGSSTDPLIGLYQEGIAELNVEPYDEDQGTGELRYVQMAVTTYNTSLPYAERYRNGKVQVALVWNSRDENSPSSKKLNALANFLWRYGGPNRKVHLIHSVWANFQTSINNLRTPLLAPLPPPPPHPQKLSTTLDEVSVYPIPAALYLVKNLLQYYIFGFGLIGF
ncbi:hypothetical protein ACSBR2_016096 [Camellia fascicularis]